MSPAADGSSVSKRLGLYKNRETWVAGDVEKPEHDVKRTGKGLDA